MKQVLLSCGHVCWVSFLSAFEGREVRCPGSDTTGRVACTDTAQKIVEVL